MKSAKTFVPLAAAASLGLAGALLAAPASAQEVDDTAPVVVSMSNKNHVDAGKLSVPCNTPAGNSTNFSWDPGSASTTFYYNNHCNHEVGIEVHSYSGFDDNHDCVKAPRGKKGNEKVEYGLAGSLQGVYVSCSDRTR